MAGSVRLGGTERDADLRIPVPRRARIAFAAALLVVVIGVVLRLWSFSPLWLDETQTVAFAKLPLRDLHAALRTDGAPPLYYFLLHFWISAFGANVWVVRLLSMLLSVAALPLTWRVARRLGGSTELAGVTVLLLASNPFAVRYAGEARMYSLVMLEVLLGILAVERLRRLDDRAAMVAVAGVTAAMLLTHYWTMFLLANVAWALALIAWRRPAERRLARRAAIAAGCGVVAFLPWVPTMVHQSRHTAAPWADTPDVGSLSKLPIDWFGGLGPAGTTAVLLVAPLLIVAVAGRLTPAGNLVLGGRLSPRSGLLAAISLATLTTGLTVAVVTGSTVATRYTAVVVPLALLLLAIGVTKLPGRVRTGTLAVLVTIGLLGSFTAATAAHSMADRMATVLNDRAAYGDLIVYCPDQLAPAIEDRLRVSPGVQRLELPAQPNPRVIDWTDYNLRLSDFNAVATTARISAYLRQQFGAAVWLVVGWGFRTHADVCGPLRDSLIARLGLPAIMYSGVSRGEGNAQLERYAAPEH